ncbi:MAG TPA: MarR family transcriptional regulator [Sphaerochaeta sp.]|nr:MarR family transcriptional regulator [Sphaerochaeta sp.]
MNKGGFGKHISLINRAAQGYFASRLKAYHIGPGQQAYLLTLLPHESIMQEELARRLHVDKANVTRAIKGLVEQGYVTREQSDIDKRALLITLTEKGVQVRSEVEAIAFAWIQKVRAPLSDEEWNTMEGYLERMAKDLIQE